MSKPDTTLPSVGSILSFFETELLALRATKSDDDRFNGHSTARDHEFLVARRKILYEATSQIEALILDARIDERNEVALDNYRGQTFSDSTDYKGKFDKFVLNNEKRLATLKAELGEN